MHANSMVFVVKRKFESSVWVAQEKILLKKKYLIKEKISVALEWTWRRIIG